MRGITAKSTLSQILNTIAAHKKAASFWGFDKLATVVANGEWKNKREKALYIHSDFNGMVAALDKLG